LWPSNSGPSQQAYCVLPSIGDTAAAAHARPVDMIEFSETVVFDRIGAGAASEQAGIIGTGPMAKTSSMPPASHSPEASVTGPGAGR